MLAILMLTGQVAVSMTGQANAGGASKFTGTWVLTATGDLDATLADAAQAPFFTISGRTISGFDGCNRFSGDLDKPGLIRATRRGCKDGYLKLPLDLADPASHLARGRLDGRRLQLPAQAGLPPSEFVRK